MVVRPTHFVLMRIVNCLVYLIAITVIIDLLSVGFCTVHVAPVGRSCCEVGATVGLNAVIIS